MLKQSGAIPYHYEVADVSFLLIFFLNSGKTVSFVPGLYCRRRRWIGAGLSRYTNEIRRLKALTDLIIIIFLPGMFIAE